MIGTKGSIFLWDKEEWGSLWGFGGDDATSFKVFFNKGFTSILLGRIKWVDFSNLGNKSVFEVNGVVEGMMGRKLFISLLGEYISEVGTKLRNGNFFCPFGLSNFGRDGEFVQVFICRSIQGRALMKSSLNPLGIRDDKWVFGMEVYSEVLPVNLGLPFLKPGHSKNDLWTGEMNNHESNHIREGSRGKRNVRSPKNSSLVIWSSIYIVSGDGRRYLR